MLTYLPGETSELINQRVFGELRGGGDAAAASLMQIKETCSSWSLLPRSRELLHVDKQSPSLRWEHWFVSVEP